MNWTKRKTRTVAIASLVMGSLVVAGPAMAADKNIGAMSTSSACSGTYYSVISGTASKDGSAKVDFHNLKFGARAQVPSSCSGNITKLCLDVTVTATSKSGGITSSAPFGATLWNFKSVGTLARAGSVATQSAQSCVTGNTKLLTVSANPEDGTAFVTTGGVYKLKNYSISSRATVWIGGTKYVGNLATSTQTP